MRVHATRGGYVFELRPWCLKERPPFGTLAPCGLRPVERTFALLPVEACQVSTRHRHPDDAVAIDVHSPRRKAPHRGPRVVPWRFIVFRQGCLGRVRSRVETHNPARKTEYRTP